MQVYSVKPGGAVLASLEERDPEYEERLREAGIKFEVTSMPKDKAPEPDTMQRATLREVEVLRAGKTTREKQIQIDREGFNH